MDVGAGFKGLLRIQKQETIPFVNRCTLVLPRRNSCGLIVHVEAFGELLKLPGTLWPRFAQSCGAPEWNARARVPFHPALLVKAQKAPAGRSLIGRDDAAAAAAVTSAGCVSARLPS